MDALTHADKADKGECLARAIADMHSCESTWWYACAQKRGRPKRVLN